MIFDHCNTHLHHPIAQSYFPHSHPNALIVCHSLQACLMVHSYSSAFGKPAIIFALCFKSLLGILSRNTRESRYCCEAEDASNEGVNIHFTSVMGKNQMAAGYC
ncbi:uncharacterized [Tachysurus ichikawai]